MAEADKIVGTSVGEKELQIVTFFLGKEEFGVEILLVKEIIRPSPVTEVPNTPVFLEGVINLRGNVVPVVDLRKRLNLTTTPADKDTRIIIIDIEDRVVGFIVDSVSRVITIPGDSIQKAPDVVTVGVESEYILGVSRIEEERLIILLDFSKILSPMEKKELSNVE